MKFLTVTVIPSLLVLSTAAISGEQTTQNDRVNANRPLTEQQIAPVLNARRTKFQFMDLNDDGYIVRDEIGQGNTELQSQFASLDANNDGKLSVDEYVLSHRTAID